MSKSTVHLSYANGLWLFYSVIVMVGHQLDNEKNKTGYRIALKFYVAKMLLDI